MPINCVLKINNDITLYDTFFIEVCIEYIPYNYVTKCQSVEKSHLANYGNLITYLRLLHAILLNVAFK